MQKIILDGPPETAMRDEVATNLAVVIAGTARLLLLATAAAFVIFFAFIGGIVKANNRGRRKSW